MISCSSGSEEFASLLHFIRKMLNGKAPADPLAEINYINESDCVIKILRGGFPINFDNTVGVPASQIQLTRTLVAAGLVQAAEFLNDPKIMSNGGNYMLDPKEQKFIAKEWLKYQPRGTFSQEIMDNFENEEWIKQKSGGIYVPRENIAIDTNNHKESNFKTLLKI